MRSTFPIRRIFKDIEPLDLEHAVRDGVQPDLVQDVELVRPGLDVEMAVVGVASV